MRDFDFLYSAAAADSFDTLLISPTAASLRWRQIFGFYGDSNKGSVVVLDEKDARILRELERDCRQRTNQIAKETNLPITTCHNRIKKLSASGHIAHFRAVLDPEKLGRPLLSFVFATLNRESQNRSNQAKDAAILARIASYSCVQEAHKVSGDWDVLLKIRTGSVRELNEFISETLQGQQLIDRAQTYVAMETHKETTNLIYNGKR